MLIEFTSEIFSKETFPYSITSWIANSLMYEDDAIDFIVYPSFATQNMNCNIAIHPNFVDKYLKLSKIYKYIISESNKGYVKINLKNVGKIINTNILWNEPTEEDIKMYFPDAIKNFINTNLP
jgi:hypothetical protein